MENKVGRTKFICAANGGMVIRRVIYACIEEDIET
jgi:hypothetical protein